MSALPTPITNAASTNSRRFNDSVCPRTMRAIVSHPTAPMAMNSTYTFPRAKIVDRMMTMKMYGSV